MKTQKNCGTVFLDKKVNVEGGEYLTRYQTNIAELRKRLKMTQQAIGLKFQSPVDVTVVSRWERGITRPDAGNLLELAKALKVNPDEIVFIKIDRQDSL
ncbi:helix-turn-helix domain-containing protein [Gorillibacterium timonense]|uniref:helix-turn-helix domain-containing protein n=1 Tax=Gorillibacterium timonense TaxID=1689269 RepID=UPI00071DAB85|nr:helix-turn-helix transcriptional regulator [Gorillibacterium timonense]